MGSNLIDTIRRFAKPPSILEIRCGDAQSQQQLSGTLLEVLNDGVVVDCDGVITFVRADQVLSFRVLRKAVRASGRDSGPEKQINGVTSTSQPSDSVQSQEVPGGSSSIPTAMFSGEDVSTRRCETVPAVHAQTSAADGRAQAESEPRSEVPIQNSPDTSFALFSGTIVSPAFEPEFLIAGLNKDDYFELVRWKNRYDYALKIHELSRIRDDVPAITRFAESLKHPEVLTLAGVLALKIGDTVRAKDLLGKACSIRSATAAKVMAYIAAEQQNYSAACDYFSQFIAITDKLISSDHDVLIACGRALNHAKDRSTKGLGNAITKAADPDTEKLARWLVAFALEPSSAKAAEEVLRGDIRGARTLLPDSPIFEDLSPPSPTPASSTKTISAEKVRTGKITANYADRRFGFLADDTTGETYFFRILDVRHPELRRSLEANRSGQRVEFLPGPNNIRRYGRYDPATVTKWIDEPSNVRTETSVGPSRRTGAAPLAIVPSRAGAYGRAKRAELLVDLTVAETEFKREIEHRGKNWLSAVKDLSWLLSRIGRGEEAIALLEQYRNEFDSVRPVDNLLAHINLKLSRFEASAALFRHLQAGADARTRLTLIRQEAFCAFAQSKFSDALALLDKIHRQNPFDMQTSSLIERVKQARDSRRPGIASPESGDALDIEAFSSGLSPFAKLLLDSCDFRGVDERSKVRGYFDEKDFNSVENLVSRVRGRRPRERADYSLTLAAMAYAAPESAGTSVHELLRRYFTFMGEAAIYDGLHRDVARCYLAEAICYANEDTVETPLAFLVATYLQTVPSASELSSEIRMQNILPQLETDPKSWERFGTDCPYYSYLSVVATKRLDGDIRRNKGLRNFLLPAADLEKQRNKEAGRLRKEFTQLRALQNSLSGAGILQDNVAALSELADITRFELDRQRLKTISSLFGEASSYWQEQDFVEKESKKGRLASGLAGLCKEIEGSPTKLSVEALQPLAKRLLEQTNVVFEDFQRSAQPEITLKNVLGEDYSILSADGSLPVSLQLTSKPGSAPVEGIEIELSQESGLALLAPAHSPEMLRGGQSREVRVLLKPTESQVSDRAFTLAATVKYRSRQGEIGETRQQTIPIRLGTSADFTLIANPYQAYSGGTVVDDPGMFFGRTSLLTRIREQVTTGPVGQCFVMYGQKRSGKSSVLRQLERRINLPTLTVPVTLGEMDVKEAESSFVRLCIDRLHDRLSIDLGVEVRDWVSSADVSTRPLDSFKRALKSAYAALEGAGLEAPRMVLLIDEFTYLFEYIKEGIVPATFMRHWKALLQMQLFSAVVVGQDSMPKFKQAFANEFGVTHDERITYLGREEATALAEAPIFFEGKSRYRGKALARLLDLTAGSPFYLQIMCDRLVRHLNRQRAVFITEADIDIVARDLVFGDEALPIERFDPLITAAGESVAEVSRDTYLQVLNAVAHRSRLSGFAQAGSVQVEHAPKLLQDLADREIVSLDSGGRVSIRVQLFAEWLRTNCALD